MTNSELADILAPDADCTRTWCGEDIMDDQDAVTLHEGECSECQVIIFGR